MCFEEELIDQCWLSFNLRIGFDQAEADLLQYYYSTINILKIILTIH